MESINQSLEVYKQLTFEEHFNYDIANTILKNWDILISQLPEARQLIINEKKKDYDLSLTLKKICKNINGVNLVKYSHSKNSSLLAKGRLFAKSVSLQNLPRELRGALATGKYHDVDMVNAHPTILYQYCNKNNIDCPKLKHYVNNREEVINNIIINNNLKYEEIKNKFLCVLNGGEQILDNPFFNDFKKEIKLIHLQINSINKELEKIIKRKKDYNINGSITNIILCDIENTILLLTVQYLISKGYNVDVLVFDGLMIRKNKELLNLNELSQNIKNVIDYDIQFIEKPLINIFNFDLIPSVITNEPTYSIIKKEFELNHFKIIYPPIYVSIDDNNDIILQSKDSMSQSYEHITATKEMKDSKQLMDVVFIHSWFKDDYIRKYDKIDFYPNKNDCPANHYNLCKGFKAENYEPINNKELIHELIKPIIYHLKLIAQEHYEYLIKHFAFILQYPAKKTNVNIVVSGKDGTGKSIIFDFFRNMILGHDLASQTDDTDDLFSRFSNIYVNKLFLQIDEISSDDFKRKKAEKLKNIVVSKTIKYEKKGLDQITINNYINLVMTTNNDFTIPISQHDRRNVFFKINDKHLQDKEYFLKLSSVFNQEETARAFYEYLMDYDLSLLSTNWTEDAGLQGIRPITDYHKEVKLLCLPIIDRFASYLTDYTHNHDKLLITIQAAKLYTLYNDWFDRCNFNTMKSSITKFGMDIKKYKGITQKRGTDHYVYVIDKKELKEYLENNSLYDNNAFA